MTTSGALDYKSNDSCVDPKWLSVKVMTRKGYSDKPMQ